MKKLLIVVLVAAAGCTPPTPTSPEDEARCASHPECFSGDGVWTNRFCETKCIEPFEREACCDCLAASQVEHVVGDGVQDEDDPFCVGNAGECVAALVDGDLTVPGFCVDEQCPSTCDAFFD